MQGRLALTLALVAALPALAGCMPHGAAPVTRRPIIQDSGRTFASDAPAPWAAP